jgi:hypothetical protein
VGGDGGEGAQPMMRTRAGLASMVAGDGGGGAGC